ncbi:MAG: hypothetical protein JXQ65_12385 [Candidatus Marinimicrobia bacterium]|nr:hypothetical protein [Candidatus Neomarinimicrobiota bacterium]
MKWIKILILIVLVFLVSTCESPVKTKDDLARINIAFNFPEKPLQENALQKATSIQVINIVVEAADMDRISEDFNVNNTRVVCNLEVPKGNERLFKIQGKDAGGIVQLTAETTEDILNSEETITINNIVQISPPPVEPTFSDISESGFVINWNKSNAPDFSHYRVLVSTNTVLNLNSDKIGNDIEDKNSVTMTISGADPGTVYYVAIVVFDTENYYSGNLQYGANNSIVRRVETQSAATVPEPVDVDITNILSTSFQLNWSRSNAQNFNFYRVLLSHNSTLHADNDKIGTDITDINRNTMLVDDLMMNTVYYTAVLTVSNTMDFLGSLEYGSQYSIVHKVTTADMVSLGYDDGSFENLLYSTAIGARFCNAFTQPAPNTFIREVWVYLNDTSGEDGNYRIVIVDQNGNDKFYSNALSTTYGEQWVGWQIPWENIEDGFISGDFAVGVEMVKDIGWPEVGLDQSSNYESSFYVDASGTWNSVGDLGYPGNLGILVVVDIEGEEGMKTPGASTLTLKPFNNGNMSVDFKRPGTIINSISGQDKRTVTIGEKSRILTRR